MGLADVVKKAARTALNATGDLRVTATFERVSIGAYSPATDVQTETLATSTVKGILSKEKSTESNKNVDERDMQLLVAALDLGFEPSTDDSLTIDGVRHQIMRVRHVPGKSVFKLTVRVT
jgi:hypothetical protein